MEFLWLILSMGIQLFSNNFRAVNGESRFVILPQSQTVLEGESVVFNCQATSVTDLIYSWTHNGHALQNSSRIYQLGSNLHLNQTLKDVDAGEYVCIATSNSSGARQASPPAHLNFIWLKSANVQLVFHTKEQLILKCRVEGFNDYKVEWFRNEEKLNGLENIHVDGDKLTIRNPSLQHAGIYSCIASNKLGHIISTKNFNLKWFKTPKSSPTLDTIGSNHHPVSDSSSNSNHTYGGCTSKLYSKKFLKSLGINERRKDFLCRGKRGDRLLSLSPQITGENVIEEALNSSDVIKISKDPSRIVVKENDFAELHCSYDLAEDYKSATNLLRIKWRKDGKVFRQSEISGISRNSTPVATVSSATTATTLEPNMESMIREDGRIVFHRHNGSLIFNGVIASDAGFYDCQIFLEEKNNSHSTTSKRGELIVIEQLKFVPQPTSKNLELGSIGKIHCKAQGTPIPQVKWIRENSEKLPENIEDINGTLIFRNVSSIHRGNYTCIASNSQQGQINASISVGVVVAPKFSVPPRGPLQAIEMGTASIHCQAIGDPKPTIQWDKDLQYLSDNNTDLNRFKFLENGTLLISEVHLDDEGRYGCTIGNSAGLKREEVRLIVRPADGLTAEESSDGFMITKAVLITMSVAFAYIILVIGLMLWCRYRRQARKARLNLLEKENVENGRGTGDGADGDGNKNAEIEPCLPEKNENLNSKLKMKKVNGNNNPKGSGTDTAAKSDDTISSVNSKGSKKSFDHLTISRMDISEMIQIGRGEFGDVFVGKIKSSQIKNLPTIGAGNTEDNISNGGIDVLKENRSDSEKCNAPLINNIQQDNEKRKSKTSMDNIDEIKEDNNCSTNSNEYRQILVKALNKIKDESACQEFKRQIELFRAISHKGVSKLYGLCRDKDPHYMVLEYTDWGDLKQFLLATAGKATGNTLESNLPPLKLGQILAIAYQIARGMDAIYRARYIHKDLATRNCIISSEFIVKISYPALCKDKYSREYYKHRNSLLPLRWLAPECIQEDDYTTKSDIFAFAVLVWELFTQAVKLPFEELTNEEFIQRNQSGGLNWNCADGTPDDLKEILLSCWSSNPKDRPSFSQLSTAFSKSIQTSDK